MQGHVTGHGAGQDGVGTVVLVERLEDHDFVARVDRRQHGGDHRFGRAATHGDLRVGVDRDPVTPGEVSRHGVA